MTIHIGNPGSGSAASVAVEPVGDITADNVQDALAGLDEAKEDRPVVIPARPTPENFAATALPGEGSLAASDWYYYIQARFADGSKSDENNGSVTIVTGSTGGVRLTWDAVDGADEYAIIGRYEYDWVVILDGSATEFTDDGTEPEGSRPFENADYYVARAPLPVGGAGIEFGVPWVLGGASGDVWAPLDVSRFSITPGVRDVADLYEFVPASGGDPDYVKINQPGTYYVGLTATMSTALSAADEREIRGQVYYPIEPTGWIEDHHSGWQRIVATDGSGNSELVASKVMTTAGYDSARWAIGARMRNDNVAARTVNDLVLTIIPLVVIEL